MKKIYLLSLMVLAAIVAKAEITLDYTAGAELVSAYLWRGQYNGGLSLQPDLEVGFSGRHIGLSAGVWGSVGISDWKFQKGLETEEGYNPNTYFMPELDVIANFSFFGIQVGMTHYQYFLPEAKDNYQTEITLGYNFDDELEIPLYISWNTFVAGDDFNGEYDENDEPVLDENGDPKSKRAFSSYLEIGYDQALPRNFTLGAKIGMSPWASEFYGNDRFAVVNVSARLEKAWEVGPCEMSIFAEGCLNPYAMRQDKENEYLHINAAGDDKLYMQTLNGTVGLGIWF
ncbi:MAG: hypothetical protein MJZ75_01140 [Paludibacteraceae bacterium]|nr:hypothetical protein [Paludibacteraceae bacterium]